jgi:hypothetical protein
MHVSFPRAGTYLLPMKEFAALVLLALVLPTTAYAHAKTVAPPGNSGVSQYLETIPTAQGGRPSATVNSGGNASGGQGALSAATERAFAKQGAIGVQAAALVNATAPSPAGSRSSHKGTATLAPSASQGPPPSGGIGDSAASSVAKALTGSSSGSGLGWLLPAILASLAIAGGAVALIRRRRAD